MSTESIKENAVRKIIQELIVPDLSRIINKQDILEERINSLRNELKSDMSRLDEKVDTKFEAVNDRIDSLKNEMNVKFDAMDNKMETKFDAVNDRIDSLNDKIDLMNKYNERLLDIIHPVQK
ncbi:MAG: hypothetical protein ACYCSQ_02110 [bacterium]